MDNTETMRSTYARLNAGDVDGFGDLVASGFVAHEPLPGLAPTKEGVLEYFRLLLQVFPDMQMHVEDLIAQEDKTVARVRVTGTQEGDFMGIPPTGRRVEMELIDIMRFDADGLVCEHWGVADMFSLMQQLSAVSA